MSAPEASNSGPAAAATLVLDFDGTVCLGDGPVWAYADGVLPHLEPEVARGVTRQLRAYLADHPHATRYADGYTAVAELAGPHLSSVILQSAYADSRRALEDDGVALHAPPGLAEVLDQLRPAIRAVVVTNAPSTGLDAALIRLGLADRIDDVICSAGKPDRSAAVLDALLAGGEPATLMSVGDIWDNDIAPALELGCAGGFIDRSGRDLRPAHVTSKTIQGLYPAIAEWARAPREFVSAHRPTVQPNHRFPDGSRT